jgi:hypothetical protein
MSSPCYLRVCLFFIHFFTSKPVTNFYETRYEIYTIMRPHISHSFYSPIINNSNVVGLRTFEVGATPLPLNLEPINHVWQ